jgi:hypothetical protein
MRPPFLPLPRGPLGSAAVLAVSLFAAACETPPPEVPEPGPPQPVVEYLSRQEVLTPLPLRVQLPARYGAERLFVLFHTWGSRDWDTMELARSGQTWTGEISCRQVSTVTGDTRYFFVALDAGGEIVAGSGSPDGVAARRHHRRQHARRPARAARRVRASPVPRRGGLPS